MKVNCMKKYLFLMLLLVSTNQVFSQMLSANAPERKQLIAMGYEFDKEAADDTWSVASNGDSKIIVSRSDDRLFISRLFTRRAANEKEENELLKIVNEKNYDLAYQIVLLEDTVAVNLYDHGPYNPKNFSKLVRLIEKAEIIFDEKFLKLIND